MNHFTYNVPSFLLCRIRFLGLAFSCNIQTGFVKVGSWKQTISYVQSLEVNNAKTVRCYHWAQRCWQIEHRHMNVTGSPWTVLAEQHKGLDISAVSVHPRGHSVKPIMTWCVALTVYPATRFLTHLLQCFITLEFLYEMICRAAVSNWLKIKLFVVQCVTNLSGCKKTLANTQVYGKWFLVLVS